MPWSMSCSRVRLCCSLSWRTGGEKQKQRYVLEPTSRSGLSTLHTEWNISTWLTHLHTHTHTHATKGNLTFSTTENHTHFRSRITSTTIQKEIAVLPANKTTGSWATLLKRAVWKTSWENSQDIFLCPLGWASRIYLADYKNSSNWSER